jgi:hypothetical protein
MRCILLMPTGTVQPLGFASTGMFRMARWLGIEADFVQIRRTTADSLTKSRMSPEFRGR